MSKHKNKSQEHYDSEEEKEPIIKRKDRNEITFKAFFVLLVIGYALGFITGYLAH